MIDRKLYLELCQRCTIGMGDVFVKYENAKYIPHSLLIWFNDKGETQNTAVLFDLNGKTVINCRLQDVYLDKTK